MMTPSSMSPVIILGMHRSGTTMVTRMLRTLGLFVGWRRDGHEEAHFFRHLNDWMMLQCGGAWDHPLPTRLLTEDEELRRLTAEYLRLRLRSPGAVSFFGPVGGAWRAARPALWGWKDPRNTFTAPVWWELFPTCRLISVHRHGIDVAASLVKRQAESRRARVARFARRKPLYRVWRRRGGLSESYRCGDLDRAVDLWGEYEDEARRIVAYSPGPSLEIMYESLIEEPAHWIAALAEFVGVEPSAAQIARARATIRPGRAFAFRADPHLHTVAAHRGVTLAASGYGPDGFSGSRDARDAGEASAIQSEPSMRSTASP